MTTTAFQWLFDNAESISINKRGLVSQTISRDNTVRAVSRGGQIWRFDVTMPGGMVWSDARPYIEQLEAADRFTTGQVAISHPGYSSWFTPYRGDATDNTNYVVDAVTGSNQLTITAGATAPNYKFKTGDVIQLGETGAVYSVTSDVTSSDTVITVNRPVIDATGSYRLIVGPLVKWNVICTQFPTWTISNRNVVTWSGNFSFFEVA